MDPAVVPDLCRLSSGAPKRDPVVVVLCEKYHLDAQQAQHKNRPIPDTGVLPTGASVNNDGANGVVYDEASGQYYDTNSGQYYDSVAGTWYYPDRQPDSDTVPGFQLTSLDTPYQNNSVVALPVNNDNVKDGAAFFDSLVSTQEQPYVPETQVDARVPEQTNVANNANSQILTAYDALSGVDSTGQVTLEQSLLSNTITSMELGGYTSRMETNIAGPLVVPEVDLEHDNYMGERTISSPPNITNGIQVLSDPAVVVDAVVAAASDVAAVELPGTTVVANMDNGSSKSGGTTESMQLTAAAVTVGTMSVDVSQIPAVTDDILGIYPQAYASNDFVSVDSPQVGGTHNSTYVATISLSGDDPTVLEDTTSQTFREEYPEPSMHTATTHDQQSETVQRSYLQPSNDGAANPASAELFQQQQQQQHPPSEDHWGMYTEQPLLDTPADGLHVPNGQHESITDERNNIPQSAAPPTTDDASYLLGTNTDSDKVNHGYANVVYPQDSTGNIPYTDPNTSVNTNTFLYSHSGDDEVGAIQHQPQPQQHQQHDLNHLSGTYIHTSPPTDVRNANIASVPLDPYARSSVPSTYSEHSTMHQDISGATYDTVSHAMVPQSTAGYDSQINSNRPSMESFYHDRGMNASSWDIDRHDGGVDPLGRLNACYPVMAFGFGGKFASMFPKQVQRLNIYDNEKASRVAPGILGIQALSKLISKDSGIQDPQLLCGAPLLAGETTRTALLKRREAAVSGGKAWLDMASAANALCQEEKSLFEVLLAVLEAFDDTDPQKLELNGALEPLRALFCQADGLHGDNELLLSQLLPEISNGDSKQIRALEMLLLDGKREEAIATACSQGLWAHALIIASCTGKQHWQSVVSAYTQGALNDTFSSLKIQYRLFSGLGAHAFDGVFDLDKGSVAEDMGQFVTAADIEPSAAHSTGLHSVQALSEGMATGVGSPPQIRGTSNIGATRNWAKTLSLILANRTSGDQGAILKLGDCLKNEGNVLAAHICYALTLQSKDIFLSDMPQSAYPRAILLGADELDRDRSMRNNTFGLTRIPYSRYYRHGPAFIAMELYELAFALKSFSTSDPQVAAGTPSSSQTPATPNNSNTNGANVAQGPRSAAISCLPHFQAYKLQHAWWLADCGQTALASRYCDAILGILATLPQGVAVPFIHSSFVQGLADLRERLSGAGMTSIKAAEIAGDATAFSGANAKSWLARAMPRPSFASLMTAFDSSIDKFITGADGSRISLESSGTTGKYDIGPDRHSLDIQPPQPHSPPRPHGTSSWGRRTPSPHLASVAASGGSSSIPRNSFEQPRPADAFIPLYGSPRQSMDGRSNNSGYTMQGMGEAEPSRMFTPSNASLYADNAVSDMSQSQSQMQQPAQPQWGDPANSGSGFGVRNQFIDPASAFGTVSDSFANPISGMAASYAATRNFVSEAPSMESGPGQLAPPGTTMSPGQAAILGDNDDEEDMFGFSKKTAVQAPASRSTRQSMDASRKSLSASVQPSVGDSAQDQKTGTKLDSETEDKAGSGVMGMLKSLWGGRKPQANLGEQSNFVYDPELKRWVDRNSSVPQTKAAPVPPPPPSAMRFQPQSASVPPQHEYPGMESRPGSVLPPPPSTDPSRTGTPASAFDNRTSAIPPHPASTGGISSAKRRGARAKYVNAM
ncbi:hypothetical protein IWW48_004885 [Coemansia sp. RSA 1200]|nr:hypothetical protein IWW48_004885 [Coemansia sp. RSA 1200]